MTRQINSYYQPLHFSRHAEQRMGQRSINYAAIDLLLAYGDAAPCGGRASAITLAKHDLQDLREHGISATMVAKLSRLRAIQSADGTVVTVMHRYHRPTSNTRRMRG